MDNRDCILISWPARDIEGIIFPVIKDLSDKFKIIVLVLNVSKTDNLNAKLDLMKKEKIIIDYYVTPKKMQGILFHLYLKQTMNLLKKCNIKLWLCSSDMQISEKYISDNLVKPNTKRICLWPPITYLFMYHQALAKQLLSDYEFKEESIVDLRKSHIGNKLQELQRRKDPLKSLIKYILLNQSTILRFFAIKVFKNINNTLNRYIYPLLMAGKFYGPNKLENMTQLSDGSASAYIFFDNFEVKAHKKLFRNNNKYLSYIRTNNKNISFENKVLGILSGWESDKLLDNNILDMYVNDFIKVCKLYKTNAIDLRPHPDMDEKNNYSFQIADALKSQGINCQVTSCESSVVDESLKYVCIAGFASAALRDVRLFNQSIGVIGFESISKKYFSDPKFAFGSSEGIDWINCNGDLVRSNKYNLADRLSVSEIINEVCNY